MNQDNQEKGWSRRSIIKGLASLPLAGGVVWAAARESMAGVAERKAILESLNIKALKPPVSGDMSGDPIRVGIVGYGGRGEHLCRVMGFANHQWLKSMEEAAGKNPKDTRLKDFQAQENLNVMLTAVCDVFDVRAKLALESFNTEENKIKRFRTHSEMIASGEIDAIIIATPDHHHAPAAIEALQAGIHVYVEKPMTHSIAETYALQEAAVASKAIFAVGHQHRQTQSFLTAQDIIEKNVLGHVSLVQTNTNRNDDNGAWQYNIDENASPQTIDWEVFLGNAPQIPFNAEHFFRWRKWWAYGSGLSGDLMTHDYDRLNCVLKMGIPKSVTSSGGIYTHRDGRNVPDVMQICMEFPDFSTGSTQESGKEKGMTLLYSATLGNQFNRGTLLMGHDATMELGNRITIWADVGSTRYRKMLDEMKIDAITPIYQYDPVSDGVDGITSATSKYFADKGLLWTYRDGKRVDSTFLHVREWLSCIRNGGKPSCGIQEGFEEAITAHMGGLSYKLGRRIDWDESKQRILPVNDYNLDEVLLQLDLVI